MKRLFRKALLAIGTCLCASFVLAETLTLNSALGAPLTNGDQLGFIDMVAAEAFRRSGLKLSLIRLPPERGLKNANAGIDDGELARVGGMEKIYPNLLPVPEKMMDIDFIAFTNKDDVLVNGWDSLKEYSVGFIKGWKIYEKNVPEETLVLHANNAQQLFTLLEKGRVDAVLFTRLRGLKIILKRQMTSSRVSGSALATKEMFMYLHKSHKDKIPRIASALADIKSEGLYSMQMMILNQKYNKAN